MFTCRSKASNVYHTECKKAASYEAAFKMVGQRFLMVRVLCDSHLIFPAKQGKNREFCPFSADFTDFNAFWILAFRLKKYVKFIQFPKTNNREFMWQSRENL